MSKSKRTTCNISYYLLRAEISENPSPSNVGLGESMTMSGFDSEISENPPPSNLG